MTVHEVFDLGMWSRRLLVGSFAEEKFRCYTVNGPGDLAVVDFLRNKVDVKGIDATPVDVFVLGLGEGPNPDVTRVGGCPVRPKKLKWPRLHGKPAQFLCQFNFADSKDIISPDVLQHGDLLLVFTRFTSQGDDHFLADDFFLFEWHSHEECELLRTSECLAPPLTKASWYGQRHRTVDLPWNRNTESRFKGVVSHGFSDFEVRRNTRLLCTIDAVKIGGLPVCSIDECTPDNGRRHLCSLPEIGTPADVSYPWVNRSAPYSDREALEVGDLKWFDGCSINFYLDAGGAFSGRRSFIDICPRTTLIKANRLHHACRPSQHECLRFGRPDNCEHRPDRVRRQLV